MKYEQLPALESLFHVMDASPFWLDQNNIRVQPTTSCLRITTIKSNHRSTCLYPKAHTHVARIDALWKRKKEKLKAEQRLENVSGAETGAKSSVKNNGRT